MLDKMHALNARIRINGHIGTKKVYKEEDTYIIYGKENHINKSFNEYTA